jgi:DmsE family decaheme c-type cytochrome
MPWNATVLTIFPEMFPGPLAHSLAGRALAEGIWRLNAVDIRGFARDKHRVVDDAPFGGGPGMVMRPDVVDAALASEFGGALSLTTRGPRPSPSFSGVCQVDSKNSYVVDVDGSLFRCWASLGLDIGNTSSHGGEGASTGTNSRRFFGGPDSSPAYSYIRAEVVLLRGDNIAKRVGFVFTASSTLLFLVGAVSCRAPRRNSGQAQPNNPAAVQPVYGVQPVARWQEREFAAVRAAIPQVPNAELVGDDQLCATCHASMIKHHQNNVHRKLSCESCHGPASEHLRTRGKEPGLILSFKRMTSPERSETCLQCHEQDGCEPGGSWRVSAHANGGVSCTDCHTAHYNVPPGTPTTGLADAAITENDVQLARFQGAGSEPLPPPNGDTAPLPAGEDLATIRAESRSLGALTPQVCYRCHANMAQQQHVAHPHQICGAVGFGCTTCHDPHGKLRPESRTDMCLKCHDMSAPTMAWHSSTHARYGVACADCHNPHPKSSVQQVVDIQHTHIDRPNRLPMSVDEPQACYKCHADMYAKNAMPSHHPIKEGKMVCSDCHDGHGQAEGNLREQTVNMVCYRCHAEKQGPFAYEHPPVTEDCTICHDPHGAVTNNMLHQPASFLCLRCHTGHRTSPLGPNHAPLLGDVGTDPNLQAAFYTDCTQCHHEIHGSDLPSPHQPHVFFR